MTIIEPQRWPHESNRIVGVSRVADNKRSLLFAFSHEPTDDELRAMHEAARLALFDHQARKRSN